MSAVPPTSVEFWFDPICPWTYITSRWAAEVSAERDFTVQWQPFSLMVLNSKNEGSPKHELHSVGHNLGRVFTAVAAAHDSAAVGALYFEIGERIHPQGRTDYPEVILEALAAAGLPAEYATAYTDDMYDATLVASTERGLALVGPGVGVPIIAVEGNAFFGPVISPAPTGADALKLWDAFAAAATVPGFFEMKRGREVGPQYS